MKLFTNDNVILFFSLTCREKKCYFSKNTFFVFVIFFVLFCLYSSSTGTELYQINRECYRCLWSQGGRGGGRWGRGKILLLFLSHFSGFFFNYLANSLNIIFLFLPNQTRWQGKAYN